MKRSIYLLLFLCIVVYDSFGQISQSEKEILTKVLSGYETCERTYFTDRTDNFFINTFLEGLPQKITTVLDSNHKPIKFFLSRLDRLRLSKELNTYKTKSWTGDELIGNGKLINLDSVLKVNSYMDSLCLSQLISDKKYIRVLSFGKPYFIDKGNSFLVHVVEVDIQPSRKTFYFASLKLILYKKAKSNWIKAGCLNDGILCNG